MAKLLLTATPSERLENGTQIKEKDPQNEATQKKASHAERRAVAGTHVTVTSVRGGGWIDKAIGGVTNIQQLFLPVLRVTRPTPELEQIHEIGLSVAINLEQIHETMYLCNYFAQAQN